MKLRLSIVLAALAFALPGVSQEAKVSVPDEPEMIITWLGSHWKVEDWGANGAESYMRSPDDHGWKARMLAMQALVKAGAESIPALESALTGEDEGLAIFAAQTLGYLPDSSPKEALIKQLRSHKIPAVRLYAADALGMKGDPDLRPVFESARQADKQGDVKKHLGYALERADKPLSPTVVKTLKNWDAQSVDSAVIGKPAPDFALQSLGGKTVRLSDYKGKSAVVLVFIYGDT